jgi:hypothetical protein
MKDEELFEKILAQPGMGIGQKSVTRLKAFMDGYMTAMHEVNPYDENFNMEFNKWVAHRFQIETSHNWASIILFMSCNDEAAAFDMTKELWEKFKSEREHSVGKPES